MRVTVCQIPGHDQAARDAGFDALFVETHPDPRRARSDAATQWQLSQLPELLRLFGAVVEARRR